MAGRIRGGFIPFPMVVNVIVRLEFEIAYYDSAVHRFNHYTTRTPPQVNREIISFGNMIVERECKNGKVCIQKIRGLKIIGNWLILVLKRKRLVENLKTFFPNRASRR